MQRLEEDSGQRKNTVVNLPRGDNHVLVDRIKQMEPLIRPGPRYATRVIIVFTNGFRRGKRTCSSR